MYMSAKKMLLPLAVATFITTTMAAAANTEYLPPSNNGYHYNVPNKPFVSETVRPTLPPPVRQTTPPRDYLPPQTTRQPPQPQPQDHHHEEHDHHHHEPGMPFDFAYAVNEDGNDFSHNARSDGDVTKGEYRIALPDGRTQIVKYTADWKNGFNAEVTYEGEAKYPEETNTGYTSRPPANPGQSYLPPNQGGGYKY